MNVRVSGKQFEIGEALPKQVRKGLQSAIEKHLGGMHARCRFDSAPELQKQLKRYNRRPKKPYNTCRAPKAYEA